MTEQDIKNQHQVPPPRPNDQHMPVPLIAMGFSWLRLGVYVASLCMFIAFVYVVGLFELGLPKLMPLDYVGISCPACGGTRSVHALTRGDLYASFRHNPLVYLFSPFAAYMFLHASMLFIFGRGLPGVKWLANKWWLFLSIAIIFAVLRNLPWWPFNLLGPEF